MIAKLIPVASFMAGLTVLPTAARAAETCSGPWVEVDPNAEEVIWGPESRCECGSMRAGLLASSKQVGWFWMQLPTGPGTGFAWVRLQVVEEATGKLGAVTAMRRSESAQWFIAESGGIEGVMSIPQSLRGFRWNGLYRVECASLA